MLFIVFFSKINVYHEDVKQKDEHLSMIILLIKSCVWWRLHHLASAFNGVLDLVFFYQDFFHRHQKFKGSIKSKASIFISLYSLLAHVHSGICFKFPGRWLRRTLIASLAITRMLLDEIYHLEELKFDSFKMEWQFLI